jgi:GDP-mannose 6-dehydrogenase
MNISIFGLGYVGSVGLACLAQNGHSVIGVDVNNVKVDLINQGKSPIVEKGLDLVIAEQRAKRRISATTDVDQAVLGTDVTFICVGTPTSKEGHLNLEAIFKVGRDIAAGLAKKQRFHVVALRSTVSPGCSQKLSSIIAEEAGKQEERDFAVIANPEFLREGTAVRDFLNPAYTLIGSSNPRAIAFMKDVYKEIQAPLIITDIHVAELIKYVNNSFHALKICFANEIGSICKKLNIDSHKLMDIFCRDTKLNISPSYLKPGFAYGGSCLPKDLKALCAIAHDHYLKSPVLESISESNEINKSRVLEMIIGLGRQRIGFLGLSFKEGTDDLRESPIISIVETLLGKGFDVKIYDKNISLSRLIGANREFILQHIPLISRFISEEASDVIRNSDLIVVVNNEAGVGELLSQLPKDKPILDLVNIDFPCRAEFLNYTGIAW